MREAFVTTITRVREGRAHGELAGGSLARGVSSKSDHLQESLNLKFRAASVIPIWVYVLYAFGTPVAIAIITVCMHFFAPEDVPGVWKPHLARSRCFFEDPARLFLYFYGPIGFLFALNIGFITHTSWTYRQIEKNSSMLKKASSPRTPNEQIHRRRDYISESKRKHLKKKFPLVFKFWNQIRKVLRHCCCWCCPDAKETCLAPLGSLTSQVSRKLSSSSIVSNLSTLSTSLRFSKSSFSMDLGDDLNTKIPSVLEHNGGITTLSHSPIGVNTVSLHDNTDTQWIDDD
ncbi:hypothetical protein E2C01_010406 [Portunus trituberculatus]|uniref:Uncharacterized protein n=1 Tax=Portunus trituberculatus TaxID=210409 RepID=A0A5B7D8J3_PORTR|nr:hypothetical protein [Portunus trituberculatus]